MSYSITMDAQEVECKIPLTEISKIRKQFEEIEINKDHIKFIYEYEEDDGSIVGKIVNGMIILDTDQHGSFKNSSDGGISILLSDYKGNGLITLTGEEGEQSIYKYTDGVSKQGKVVFD